MDERRRHLNDVIDQFYRTHQFQLDRLFTLRDIEAETEHYAIRCDNDRVDPYSYTSRMMQAPTPFRQPPPNAELVETRLNQARQVLRSYLLGELPGDYYISQIHALRDVNHAYERSCRFYNQRSHNRIMDGANRRETIRPLAVNNLDREYLQRQVQDAERRMIREFYDGAMWGDFRVLPDPDRKKAEERGEKLLLENLTKEQKKDYKKNKYFIVKGGDTGKSYKIKKGHHSNVYELDKEGNQLVGWCFIPAGSLCSGDVMLSQKIGLELHEKEALKVANPFSDNRGNNTREGITHRYRGWSQMFRVWDT
jgi:hypothetical protein